MEVSLDISARKWKRRWRTAGSCTSWVSQDTLEREPPRHLEVLPAPKEEARSDVIDLIVRGGFPEIRTLSGRNRVDRYNSYLDVLSRLGLIEVEAAATVDAEDFKHIDWFMFMHDGPGRSYTTVRVVFYLGDSIISFGEDQLALPQALTPELPTHLPATIPDPPTGYIRW